MRLEHCWEHDAVEHDVVLADEVDKARRRILPPCLPCAPLLGVRVAQLLGVGDIADRRVEPYIEHLAVCPFNRNGYAPVEVACHGTWLEVHVEPRLALAVHVGTPLFVVLKNPLLEPVLIVVKRQVPVLGSLLHQSVSRVVLVCRVDKFLWRQSCATLLALVAVRALRSTARTGANDVAVGKKFARNLVAELLFCLLHKLVLVVESAEEVARKLVMNIRSGAAVDVERDAELLKRLLDKVVIAVYHLLHGDALLACTDSNGHTMLVASAYKHHLFLLQAQIAHVDVGRHIHTSQVANVHTTIGIRQSSRDGGAFKFVFFHLFLLFCIYI